MTNMLQDLRYAVRTLRRAPLVSMVIVVALGLGIGGATVVFSVVQAIVLRPLPFPSADRLVRVWEVTPEGDRFSFSEPNYLTLAAEARRLSAVAAYGELGTGAVLTGPGQPARVAAIPVTASFFDVLAVRPALGRVFGPDADRPGTAGRAPLLLSDRVWRARFGGDENILGRTVALDARAFVVSGVMPPSFDVPAGADVWIPLAASPESERDNKALAVIGRMADAVTVPALGDELDAIGRRLSQAHPVSNGGWRLEAAPLQDAIVAPRLRDGIWVLFAAVGILLGLACANVANLLVAQAASRRAEVAVRTALGARRGRLIRQLLTESALLAGVGTLAGLLLAAWSVDAIRALGGGRIPRLEAAHIDWTVLAFAAGVGLASCLVFGLAPAWHTAGLGADTGMEASSRIAGGRQRFRYGLVAAELALALLLLVAAGLVGHSLARLTRVSPGFDTTDAVAMPVELPEARYPDDRVGPFFDTLLQRVRSVPGVVDAGASSTNPFRQSGFRNTVTPEERAADAPPAGLLQADWRSVTPRYFETMHVPLLAGRTFGPADSARAEPVVIVNQSLAARLWPDGTAVGRRIYWGGTTGSTWRVVGVAGDIRDVRLDVEPAPMLFLPHAQVELRAMTVVVRVAPGVTGVPAGMRSALQGLDPALPAPAVDEVAASRAAAVAGPRFNAWLLGTFAGIALALAVSGVYAMMAFAVSERRREIAVRLALGATSRGIVRLVLGSGLLVAGVGVAIGLVAALAVTRALSSVLYGVTPTDPLTFTAAVLGLMGAAAVACYLPARQAARLDPAAVLRR